MNSLLKKYKSLFRRNRSAATGAKSAIDLKHITDTKMPIKASGGDMPARFREIVSDPLNLLIDRVELAGCIIDDYVVLHNGIRVPASGDQAYYGNFSEILVINRGVHEPLEEFAFQEVLRYLPNSPNMLELGAYWGHYSMWCKLARPSANLCLVEADSKNLNVAKANFARNGFEAEFVNQFVGSGKFAVDRFLENSNFSKLDILHADIQGYEFEMLLDAREVLKRKAVDWIFISTHSQQLHADCINILVSHDYHIAISSDFDNETTSFDGFILAVSSVKLAEAISFCHMGRSALATAKSAEIIDYLELLSEKKQKSI